VSNNPRILLITSNFWPEISGIAVYTSDFARMASEYNLELQVLTGLPHYPSWRVPSDFVYKSKTPEIYFQSHVRRFKHFIPRVPSVTKRILFEISFLIGGILQIMRCNRKSVDVIVSVMPAVSCGFLGWFAKKWFSCSGIVVFQDISSLALKQSGMTSNIFVQSISKNIERAASIWADEVVVISDSMVPFILNLVGNKEVACIYNYAVVKETSDMTKSFRRDLGIPSGHFLIMHTGNIGYKQDLTNLMLAAKSLEGYPEIHFLIVGSGSRLDELQPYLRTSTNCKQMDFVQPDEYGVLLSEADVLIINERGTLEEMCLPSKITSYLFAKKPVVASVSPRSATATFLRDSALIVQDSDPKALADAILLLVENKQIAINFAAAGKRFADENLSALVGRQKYYEVVQRVFKQRS
jgi:colanic acid biosynthesis glycosyl transferase WcaI